MKHTETDKRLQILNSFLTTPHGELNEVRNIHRDILSKDPIFYGHLGAWYYKKGEVRDHKEVFMSNLFVSNLAEHREMACTLLDKFPPYQVAKIVDFCRQSIKKFPTCGKTAVRDYLRKREQGNFTSAYLQAKKDLKRLYASLKIKPGKIAQEMLFEGKKPAGIKALQEAKTPEQVALAIVNYKIPYTVAVSFIKDWTPAITIALVNTMTPQQVINNMGSLQKRGAMNYSEVKTLIEKKLEEAKTDKRVSTLKSKVASKVSGVSKDLSNKLEGVTQARVDKKMKGSLRGKVAILVDKSGSMGACIEAGKQVAALISGAFQEMPLVVAFDEIAYPINSTGRTIQEWEQAFRGVYPDNFTSIGCAMRYIGNVPVDSIVIITDEDENTDPYFVKEYQIYCKRMGIYPPVLIIRYGNSDQVERDLRGIRAEVQVFNFTRGDYYSLPNILPMINPRTRLDLLEEIMNTPLPYRKGRESKGKTEITLHSEEGKEVIYV